MKTPGPHRGQYRRDGVAVFPLTVKYAERLTDTDTFFPFAAIVLNLLTMPPQRHQTAHP